ncbi:hypothetical protein [Chryseobacterium aquaticum]|uniref:Uncharacterized protein n=1 Tax=Chryseobacterium aquaticum subsp. greenlandense TaxID=345663 RepID=A0A101CHV0_9FLAO|nr:hypothetical protein [Chryseobacterium aquaticum]KUJ56432.1 hypothetical protein AR686_07675 [Chryseobacterium aquaticum subsp. greenlandense]
MEDLNYILSLSKVELDSLPYDVLKWECCCKDCNRGTMVRDYGITPIYFLNRNSKAADKNPSKYWMDTSKIVWLCGKHYAIMKRCGFDYILKKYFEHNKHPFEIIKKVNQGIEKINHE